MNIPVSLLLVTYNQEEYVEEAVVSALNQNYQFLEIIISDDGSSDGTWGVIKKTVDNYSGPHKVLYRRNEVNLGIAAHIDKVINLSTGDLIIFAAGDDISYADRVSQIVNGWDRNDRRHDAICSSADMINECGEVIGVLKSSHISNSLNAEMRFFFGGFIGCTEAITRRLVEIYQCFDQNAVGNSKIFSEDRVFAFRAYLAGGILCLPEKLVGYRVSCKSVSNNSSVYGDQGYDAKRKYRLIELDRLLSVIKQYKSDIKVLHLRGLTDQGYYDLLNILNNRENILLQQQKAISKNIMCRLSVFRGLAKFHGCGIRGHLKLFFNLLSPTIFLRAFP